MTPAEMLAESDRLYAGIAAAWAKDNFRSPKKVPMFAAYYDATLNETIQTAAEKSTIDNILGMEFDGLDLVRDDINTAVAMNPNYRQSRDCTLKCKAILLRINQLKHAGRFHRTETKGDLGDVLLGGMAGWLLADEFWKRFGV